MLSRCLKHILKCQLHLNICHPYKWLFWEGCKTHTINMVKMVNCLILFCALWPTITRQQACYEHRHCHDARSNKQAKVQVFSDELPHVTLHVLQGTMLVYYSTLYKKHICEHFTCDQKNKSVLSSFGHTRLLSVSDTCFFFLSISTSRQPHTESTMNDNFWYD